MNHLGKARRGVAGLGRAGHGLARRGVAGPGKARHFNNTESGEGNMKVVVCTLKSMSPYSQSRVVMSEKSRDETHDAFEERTWRERMHYTSDGEVYIPPMAFKNCLSEAAKYKSIQVKGKGKATYTKHFEGGVMVMDPLPLGVNRDDVHGEKLFVPADGRRGGAKRDFKTFPLIPEWQGEVTFYIVDEIITEEVFAQHLEDAGKFIGIGRFRPRNNGFYGRFSVEKIQWP